MSWLMCDMQFTTATLAAQTGRSHMFALNAGSFAWKLEGYLKISNIKELKGFIFFSKCNPVYFLASFDFYPFLITFANSLDPNEDQQNAGYDLNPNC